MSIIKAIGTSAELRIKEVFGVVVSGDPERVSEVGVTGTKDENDIRLRIESAIEHGQGCLGNYYPDSGTMLAAYAVLSNLLDADAEIEVYGDIGEVPMPDGPDAVY